MHQNIIIKNKWTINNVYLYIGTHPFQHLWNSCLYCVLLINLLTVVKEIDHPVNIPTNCGYKWQMDSEKKTMADNEDGRQVMAISHFWDRPVSIYSDLRFSYLALVQDKKIMCILPSNACCTVYVNRYLLLL